MKPDRRPELDPVIVLLRQQNKILTVHLDDSRKASAMQVSEIPDSDSSSQLSLHEIRVGRINKISRDINAAFLDMGEHQTAFYSLGRHNTHRKAGDLIPVQVVREASKGKFASVEETLSLSGRYAVVTHKDTKKGVFISAKLTDDRYLHWKENLTADTAIAEWLTHGSVILRTGCEELLSAEPMHEEVKHLIEQLEEIIRIGNSRPVGTVLYTPLPSFLTALRDHKNHSAQLITDEREIYDHLIHNQAVIGYSDVRLYTDKLPSLRQLYKINDQLEEALGERVWLKSGGFLVIQNTEALTVIDVNSGRSGGKADAENNYLTLNLEACREIARQLVLRNLSGIIIVDFINMKSRENQEQLLQALRDAVLSDPMKTVVVDITPLGLVELTRKKSSPPLKELLTP